MSKPLHLAQFVAQNGEFVYDSAGNILMAAGSTPPTDATPGFSKGAIFFDTDAAAGSQWLRNDGTESSCDFNLVSGGQDLSGLTATVAEINQACDESANVETVAATNVLTAAESGKTMFLAHATEFDTKLPAPAVGLRFKFIVGLAPSGASYTITTNGTTQNVIHGIISSAEDAAGAGAQTNGTAVDVVTFVDGKAQVGDWVELICDGTLWYLQGACVQQDAITLA